MPRLLGHGNYEIKNMHCATLLILWKIVKKRYATMAVIIDG